MPADTLAQRIEAAERKAQLAADKLKQLKARKAAIESRQRAIETKRAQAVETRRKFEAGNLVQQAGLLTLEPSALLGVLLMAADQISDAAVLATASQRGQAALAHRSTPSTDGKA